MAISLTDLDQGAHVLAARQFLQIGSATPLPVEAVGASLVVKSKEHPISARHEDLEPPPMSRIVSIEILLVQLPTRREHKWTGLTEPIGRYRVPESEF